MDTSSKLPADEPLAYTVDEIALLLGLSRSATYEAIKAKEIPALRFGRRICIPRLAFHRMLEGVAK